MICKWCHAAMAWPHRKNRCNADYVGQSLQRVWLGLHCIFLRIITSCVSNSWLHLCLPYPQPWWPDLPACGKLLVKRGCWVGPRGVPHLQKTLSSSYENWISMAEEMTFVMCSVLGAGIKMSNACSASLKDTLWFATLWLWSKSACTGWEAQLSNQKDMEHPSPISHAVDHLKNGMIVKSWCQKKDPPLSQKLGPFI